MLGNLSLDRRAVARALRVGARDVNRQVNVGSNKLIRYRRCVRQKARLLVVLKKESRIMSAATRADYLHMARTRLTPARSISPAGSCRKLNGLLWRPSGICFGRPSKSIDDRSRRGGVPVLSRPMERFSDRSERESEGDEGDSFNRPAG